jgi:hypothetical protein
MGRFPAAARLTACPHSIGMAHDQVGCGPQLSVLAAHNRVVRLGAAHVLGGTACTLSGGMHARWHGDFTNAGGWLATCSEWWCSTQVSAATSFKLGDDLRGGGRGEAAASIEEDEAAWRGLLNRGGSNFRPELSEWR